MLTRHAARGASLMLAASLTGRVAALGAQVVTGFLLSDEDFGIFAAAIGVMAIAGMLRGGDAQSYLVTLPPSRRRFRTGTVFWVSMTLYLVGIVPMLAVAPSLGRHFEDDRIVTLLWILAGTVCLSPFRYVFRARINASLRFGSNAVATLINNFATYPLQIVIAVVYRDPVALALPVLVGSIAEVAYLWSVARPHRCDFIPRLRFVRPVLHQLRWLVCVAAMISLWTSGDKTAAEFIVPTAILGTYYFGYQLAIQPGRLFSTTVMNVLIPVVRRVIHDPARLRGAIRRLIGTGGFAVAGINIALLASIGPLERLVWNERWAEAVTAVQVLSAALIYTSILSIATAPFLAERRYGESLVINGIRAAGVLGGAVVGSILSGTATGISTWVAICMSTSGFLGIAWVMNRYGVAWRPIILHLLRCTAPLLVAGTISAWLGALVMEELGPGRWSAVPALLVSGATLTVLGLLATAILPADTRREVVGLAMGPVRRVLGRRSQADTDS